MMRMLRAWMALGSLVALVGCATAPQTPVALEANRLNASSGKVGVLMVMPTADTHLPGAGCLLCLAAASMANSSLTTHTKTLAGKELASIQGDVVEALQFLHSRRDVLGYLQGVRLSWKRTDAFDLN